MKDLPVSGVNTTVTSHWDDSGCGNNASSARIPSAAMGGADISSLYSANTVFQAPPKWRICGEHRYFQWKSLCHCRSLSSVTLKKGKTLVKECEGITLIKLVNFPLAIQFLQSAHAKPMPRWVWEALLSWSFRWKHKAARVSSGFVGAENLRLELGWPPLACTSE